jgi:penicillin-binding protein 1A
MFFSNAPDPDQDLDPPTSTRTAANDEDDEEEENEPLSVTQWVISWLWFGFKLGFVLSLIGIIVVTGAVIGLVKGFSERIPIVSDRSYRPNLTSQVFDCQGRLLSLLHAEENRTKILPASEIPKVMRQAIVAIEDERFYQHYGIDAIGIARAMIKNVQAGRVVQGASTLTQQLVKNAFLTSEKSFKRKAIEAMMAFQIERKYSKEEILTLYLNEIYFGHGAYGLHAAAKIYFNKDPGDLSLLECATLAGIPKSPVAFSPYKNSEKNLQRRRLVLSKMAELSFITPADYEENKDKEPVLATLKEEEVKAPYFVTYVRDILLEKYGANLVYNGGLKVYTTLDLDLQGFAEKAMDNSELFLKRPIEKDPGMNGTLICLDHKTGHIKALYGGRSFKLSQFNRATQALRQPGSSFKPFVYGCALESGMLPSDTVVDEPISYTNPWSHKVWAPKNYDLKFHGTVTLIKAICNSYNVPAVKLIDKVTPAKVIQFARKLGVTAQMEPNLSLALGSGNFTPLEMASAYGVFANQGIYAPPIGILKVVDRDGNVLEESLPRVKEVMKGVHAAMIVDMLRTAAERGTGRRALVKGRAVAGKTGTTNDYIDAWFNGFTPELVTIVQFGYDMPKSLGGKMAGGTVCGPVWQAFMEKALEKYPISDFPVPEGAVRARVCMTSGRRPCSACPGTTIVNQVFPIEALPTGECPVHSGSGRWASSDDGSEPTEFAAGGAGERSPDLAPAPGFFQMDYRRPLAQSSSAGGGPRQVDQNGWAELQGNQGSDDDDEDEDALANSVALDDAPPPNTAAGRPGDLNVPPPRVQSRSTFDGEF